MTEHPAPEPIAGTMIVRADLVGTAAFVVVGAVASLVADARTPMVVVSVLLFALGIVGFVESFFRAAQRSRSDEIGVANLYLLTGPTAPTPVKRAMSIALGVQVVASLAFGAVGFSDLAIDEVNPLAFGILVPTFGLGLNGVWAARHGRFGPRIVSSAEPHRPTSPRPATSPPSDRPMEQNVRHD